eukprot:scaffold13882_cov31-Tisochrysis_lutea.AAC.4
MRPVPAKAQYWSVSATVYTKSRPSAVHNFRGTHPIEGAKFTEGVVPKSSREAHLDKRPLPSSNDAFGQLYIRTLASRPATAICSPDAETATA